MSLAVSLPVIGLDQYLRSPLASLEAQPLVQAWHWLTDSLMAVPFFAAGAWAADVIADRAKIGSARNLDVRDRRLYLLKRSLLLALASALALAPAWFVVNKVDNPVKAQPLVFPAAHDSGDVYSVPAGVVVALVCACLIPAALWAGQAIACALTRAWAAAPRAAVMRAAIPAMLVAAVPVLAWLMYQAAGRAYASQVYYSPGTVAAVHRARPASLPATASRLPPAPRLAQAPGAFVSQAAHAVQDGLAGQAAGIPVAAMTTASLVRARAHKTDRTPHYRGKRRRTRRPAARAGRHVMRQKRYEEVLG